MNASLKKRVDKKFTTWNFTQDGRFETVKGRKDKVLRRRMFRRYFKDEVKNATIYL